MKKPAPIDAELYRKLLADIALGGSEPKLVADLAAIFNLPDRERLATVISDARIMHAGYLDAFPNTFQAEPFADVIAALRLAENDMEVLGIKGLDMTLYQYQELLRGLELIHSAIPPGRGKGRPAHENAWIEPVYILAKFWKEATTKFRGNSWTKNPVNGIDMGWRPTNNATSFVYAVARMIDNDIVKNRSKQRALKKASSKATEKLGG